MTDQPFRFKVVEAFALTGRGTVLTGYIEAGNVLPGDHLVLAHGDERIPLLCKAVSAMRQAEWQPGEPVLVGLSIPDLSVEQAAADDLVMSAERT